MGRRQTAVRFATTVAEWKGAWGPPNVRRSARNLPNQHLIYRISILRKKNVLVRYVPHVAFSATAALLLLRSPLDREVGFLVHDRVIGRRLE
jgi:hypothetical protein